MNRLFVTTLATVILSLMTLTTSHSQASVMRKNVYLATCALTHPLYTSDRCEAGTYWGARAAECASVQAMNECKGENNVDCIHTSVEVWTESSTEFIGYKKCVAQARVHGYEVIQ